MSHPGGVMALPPVVLKNLGDKLYDKRKSAALEIEQMVKKLVTSKQSNEILFLIQKLAGDFARSPHPNQRKGALLGLAAVACGLTNQHIKEYLPEMIPPVLESVTDQDTRVRFYAVEALYNIADIARESMLPFMLQAFDGLFRVSADGDDHLRYAVPFAENLLKDIACNSPDFDIASFVPQLAVRMESIKPYNRRFILGWIEALGASTMIDILVFLPDLLDGIFGMLSDTMSVLVLQKPGEEKQSHTTPTLQKQQSIAAAAAASLSGGSKPPSSRADWQPQEIRNMAADVLAQLLGYISEEVSGEVDYGALVENILVPRAKEPEQRICITALQWLHTFIKLAALETPMAELPENAAVIRTQLLPNFHLVLDALLHCIRNGNEVTRDLVESINHKLLKLQDVSSWSEISMEGMLSAAAAGLESHEEATRLLALSWISFLLHINQEEVLVQVDELLPALLGVMVGPSDRVVLESLSVQAAFAASSETHFKQYISRLVACFQAPQGAELLQRRGSMVLRRLFMLLGSERCFVELAARLAKQTNLKFASTMVQALNLILLTAPETKDLRQLLLDSRNSAAGQQLFLVLYKTWSHSPGAVLMLCFLAQAYEHAAALVNTFGESSWDIGVLIQLDRVVRLLEAPVFTFLRLHLLQPATYPSLMKALYGLLMVLPQGEAFKTLSARLNSLPTMAMLQIASCPPEMAWQAEPAEKDRSPSLIKKPCTAKPACKVDFQALLQHYSHLQARHTAEIELHRHAASPSSDGDTLHSRGSSLEEVWAAIPKDPVPSNKRQVS